MRSGDIPPHRLDEAIARDAAPPTSLAPTAPPAPARVAKWVNGHDYEYEFAYCSECGHMQWADFTSHADAREKIGSFHEEYKFCPNCGAKMEGGCYVE